jgi:hypothetical protein
MVIAYDNARRRHGAMTFLLRVETISEICEELKLVRRNGTTSLIRHRALCRLAAGGCAFRTMTFEFFTPKARISRPLPSTPTVRADVR